MEWEVVHVQRIVVGAPEQFHGCVLMSVSMPVALTLPRAGRYDGRGGSVQRERIASNESRHAEHTVEGSPEETGRCMCNSM